ncbi:MAG: fibronectin type III-like domain-contianing protein [Geminicoccaceae bacterium]
MALALRHQHVADLVEADREVALPFGVARVGGGQLLGDGEVVAVALQGLVALAPGHQHVADLDVAAVLETWYPGVAGAEALADVLLGAADPGGRLPVTFPADPAAMPTAAPARYPGEGGIARYDEGLLMGYRWYDATGTRPLFPFGHGLSYARFAYADLAVRPEGDGAEVAFTVTNTGSRRGTEVAQLYLGPPEPPPAPMPPRRLAGFARLDLAAGESRRVTLAVAPEALAWWSPERRGWLPAPGPRRVEVGASSRDVRLTGRLEP